MRRPDDPLETVCIEQEEVITRLSMLCRVLLIELAQFRAVTAEEEKLKEITGGAEPAEAGEMKP